MTMPLLVLLVTFTAVIVLVGVRSTFQLAMIDAGLSEIRAVQHDLERLAFEGKIDRSSAFYRNFHTAAASVAAIKAEHFPSLALLLLALAVVKPDQSEDKRLGRDAWAEASGRYKGYREIPIRLIRAMGSILQYRSIFIWIVMKIGVALLLMLGQASALAKAFNALVSIFDRSSRLDASHLAAAS